ncbi:MAG TPA: carbohydrate kinase [Hydrogenophaga sp.]|uniref:PfkB family carbohydrate kinase n=1 Tax=Hydrogenophaga sp. TaxID=1904254 RepID=UPI0008B4677C|nr:PfkB family carbohydrate kinase [Hydrogenophaga sp.]OGA78007.1 MAG: carbohydrate kinase [Burkholderiales bacterium GWE1_65_30]OGA94358.1 MAG: carbohydrate kinase [Burkholderiales bacterium GWF1_66_17]HAX21759.1 carbohydrate kinase [Hydrogenophaga sp.]HBU20455.1 carbohydrate kinase [Hydrogenophaga sp.]
MVFPSSSAPIQVATAGEALIDMITESDGRLRPCAGGAVYNLTRALGLQGVGTLYLNPLSQDRFGRLMADAIHEARVTLARETPVHEPTSLALVGLDDEGKASYSFYRDGVADRQVNAADMTAQCAAQPGLKVAVTGCLALVADDSPKYLPWLQAQRAAGRLVVVDANLRPAIVPDMAAYQASVMAALGQAHIVKVSDDDLVTLGFTAPDPLDAARELLQATSATWLALTLGPKGAVLLHRDGSGWKAAEPTPITVVDTVGAGDCFLAGLLAALLERPAMQNAARADQLVLDSDDVQHILGRAVASASLCVMQTGCVPPSRDQVVERVATLRPMFRSL